ncbi:MAG: hypothetical protein H0W36_05855 [Gemmatimonadetes bacterium]|nr:hypothetical protein [Gemmatimonadota bacterium]
MARLGGVADSEPLADREPAHPFERRALQRERSLEAYLQGSLMPRYMERLRAIQDEMRIQAHRLERAYRRTKERHDEDSEEFRARWRETARRWRFDEVNDLIRAHNAYYPIEARLALDPRTGDYVRVAGRPYRREPLGAAWILERFPA